MTAEDESKCVHHWLLESDPGHKGLGKCRKCGAEKEFPSDPEGFQWKYGRTPTFNSHDPVRSPVREGRQLENETPSDSTAVRGLQDDDVAPLADLDETAEEHRTDAGS